MHKKLLQYLKDWLSKLLVQQEDVVGVDIMPGYIRIAEIEQSKNTWTITRIGYRYVEDQIDATDLQICVASYAQSDHLL